jgi:hypothetical protein
VRVGARVMDRVRVQDRVKVRVSIGVRFRLRVHNVRHDKTITLSQGYSKTITCLSQDKTISKKRISQDKTTQDN